MIATPVPASTTPVGPPNATNTVAPPAPGQATEQPTGGFARLLDQAREEPPQAAATPGGPAETDKPAAPRASRSGPPRQPVASPGEPGAATPAAAEAGAGLLATEATDSQESSTAADAASQPPGTTDATALLATLAALSRPQTAAQTPTGAATRALGDQDAAEADVSGRPPLARPAAGALQATQSGVPGANKNAHKTVDTLSAAGADIHAGREATADATSRGFAAELQAVLPPATSTPLAAQVATATQPGAAGAHGQIAASPGSAAFAPELGATLATFVREGVQHARLELHPAEMGPLSVQIQLDGLAAQVHLSAQNADTRQALEQAMPQLAGSLREAGLTLSGGGVSEQPRQAPSDDRADGGGRRNAGGQNGEAGEPAGAQALHTAAPARRRGVVDLVA